MAKVNPDTKRAVWIRDRYRCRYCGVSVLAPGPNIPNEMAATVDHKVPRSKGGDNTKDNLVTSCARCNAAKASDDYEGFRRIPVQERVRPGTRLKRGY